MATKPGVMDADSSSSEVAASGGVVRRLTLLYVFALSTVAVLSIGAQWLVQRQLQTGESDSRVINLAGRQRMLSQRLAKAALRLEASDPAVRTDALGELDETLRGWKATHRGLQRGSTELQLPGANSAPVAKLFARIEPHFEVMRDAAERLLEAEASARDTDAIAAIQHHEGEFLAGMDALVYQYVGEAEQRVARLRRLELAILGLTLAVLLVEGMVVFRPAVRRIERTVARLASVSDRLRVARDDAEQANAAKTRFLANVSHELRTPMTAVLGMNELARNAKTDAERADYLSIVDEAGETLLALLNDLIDLARIDSDELTLEAAPFAAGAPVSRVSRMMQSAADEKGIALRSPSAPTAFPKVLGDRRRIEQVLINFVSNAIKSTEQGAVTVRCDVLETTPERQRLRYRVSDTGVGIAAADQQRIFEPFTQLPDGRNGATGGAGLGLAICRRIASAMGAQIEIESEPGVGTTLSLTCELPIASSEREASKPDAAPRTQPLRVLVVEDVEVNRKLLGELLRRAGHVVDLAGSAAEATDAAASARPDLALIDLHLPDADGVAVAEALRGLARTAGRSAPKTVCVTAAAEAEVDPRIGRVFDAVLVKPVRGPALLSAIASLFRADDSGADSSRLEEASASVATEEAYQAELAAAFLRCAEPQVEALRGSIVEQRFDDARVIAHRLAGQVAYFDAPDLRAMLHRCEAACLDRDVAMVADLEPRLGASIGELVDRLRTQNATAPTPGLETAT